ncbi:hypothetical protein TARUN_3041 [Trichoderma arundinaceum]|uniref:Uncharacterized protein n=1 Tax=Trichoderma arundinaceum TaxID=490622 RepID=A0A395NT96_TRIAR|nr:hypothetical protein TARUN_3041 [Trichoderma arundinaceum]
MAPKEPFKVHSLSKHIEDTKKGLSASAQYNRRPVSKPSAAAVKSESGIANANIFGNNDDSDESSESSDSDSDEESSADLMKKLSSNGAKPSTAPKRRSRDEEIADSDVERNASAKRTAATKKEQLVKKESSSSETSSESSSESESESEPEQSEPRAKTNGASAKQAAAAQESSSSSSEEESESESESSDEEEAPKPVAKKPAAPAAPAATNGTAKADDSSSSSEEESSEEESSEDEAEPSKPESTKKTTEESSSSDSNASESEDDDEQVDESMHLADREAGNQVAAPKFIAPDFTLRKGDDGANGQDVARICNEANLQGKQFWYFTVPSNVPISVIQNLEIPMDRSQLGDAVFSHEGQDYGVSFDAMAPKSSIQILIPSANDSKYRSARQQIDQTMHIKRITSLGGAGASSAGPAPRRAPRPQPKGLKARYQPFGVNTPMGNIGADAAEDEDVEMGEAPEATATPKSAKKDKKSKKEDGKQSKSKDKKKSTDDAAVETNVEEAKSSKADRKGKRKHTISEDDAFAAAQQLMEEHDSAESKSKKQKMARVSSPDLGAELPSTTRKETPVAPPAIPSSSYSFSNLPSSSAAFATPSKVTGAAPSTAKKSAKKAKPETPIPTPRQTAVPIPNLPLTSRPKESPVPLPSSSTVLATTPLQSKVKRSKKSTDEVNVTGSSQQSPPPSAQGGDKKKPAIKVKKLV